MNLINHTSAWVKGEVTQGRIMLVLGIILLISCFFIWKNGNELIKGMLIPLSLVTLALAGYGIFMNIDRPKQLNKVKIAYEESPINSLKLENSRIEKDLGTYSKIKFFWAVVILIGLGLYFFGSGEYYKGLALGLIFFGASLMTLDTVLEKRASEYHTRIQTLLNS